MKQLESVFKTIFIVLLGITSPLIWAQSADALLMFEDAERAFNQGNYDAVFSNLDEVERETGVTSNTLYLRISAQDKLLEIGRTDLLDSLKANVDTYLEKLKTQDPDDRYRFVYEIDKKINRYLAGSEYVDTQNDLGEGVDVSSKYSAVRIYGDYLKTVIGETSLDIVKSVSMETVTESTGSDGKPVKTESILVKAFGKQYLETKVNGEPSIKMVYNQGQGYTEMNLVGEIHKDPIDPNLLEFYKKNLETPEALIGLVTPDYIKNEETKVLTGRFNGERVFVVKFQNELNNTEMYFSQASKLLLGRKDFAESFISNTVYKDYRNVSGFLISFTTVTETEISIPETTSVLKKKSSLKKKKPVEKNITTQNSVTRIASFRINDPVPDNLFD